MKLCSFFSCLAGRPCQIVSGVNEYHISEKAMPGAVPVSRQVMVAKKSVLTGRWSLYVRKDAPGSVPQGTVIKGPLFPARLAGAAPRTICISNLRFGNFRKMKGGLSLQQAFDAVRTFEEEPAPMKLRPGAATPYDMYSRGLALDNMLAVKTVPLTQHQDYWRNVQREFPQQIAG